MINNRILVTGASGQLASAIKATYTQFSSDDFIFADRNILDITSEEAVNAFIENNNITVVINCAAYTAVDKAEIDRDAAYLINCTAVAYIAKCCKKNNIKLIHISTDYVFNGCGYKPYETNDFVEAVNYYGESKLSGELILQKINPANSVIVRTSWVFSSYGSNFVKTIMRLGNERDTLKVISDQVGTPTYATDLAKVLLLLYPNLSNKEVEIFQYTNEGVCSWYDFALAIQELSGFDCLISPIPTTEYPTPAKRPYYSVMSKAKIKDYLGIEIPHWRESLINCLQTINNNVI